MRLKTRIVMDEAVIEFISRKGEMATVAFEDKNGDSYIGEIAWGEIKHLRPKRGTRFLMKSKTWFAPLPKWDPDKDKEWKAAEKRIAKILREEGREKRCSKTTR